ncbi:TonB-dependent siderophore receptor [Chamaesiphon sp. VAR_48_metabat_135_sub]|uniref:TonB-dependent siderophore receptor n=1 Tax=Chamaesiphon sp. VAR_48_metabat_135_sub TaxID=2964699 RepID=UPI00286B32DA|nr:TonB-dependent siderophore receptor [Chamaesiphon sp. VAR_48_metabat_135_sub]
MMCQEKTMNLVRSHRKILTFNTFLPLCFVINILAIAIAIPASARSLTANNADRSSNPNATSITTHRSTRQVLAQADSNRASITGIKLNAKDNGIEVVLETAGTISAPAPKIIGNLLYFDLPNAIIAQPFRAANPAKGIESVSVTQVDSGYIRVTVVGSTGTPQATVIAGAAGTNPEPVAQKNEPELEINVIGGLRDSYRKPNASSVTGTNTPIIETPFSVQVIPQTIIRDRQSRDVKDALSNVSGVIYNGNVQGRSGNTFSIRGFSGVATLRDGFRQFGAGQGNTQPFSEIANLEQVEVLKGPASILYGAIEPGGLINLISKKPLSTPFYEVEVQGGSRNLISPRFDVSGPLTADGKVLYRVNGLYQSINSVVKSTQPDQKTFIAPTIAWKVGDKTDLSISAEYIDSNRPGDFGLPAVGTSVANVSRDRISGEPSDRITNQSLNIGYLLDHQFSDNWKLRNAFRYASNQFDFNVVAYPLGFDETTNTVNRFFATQEGQTKDYTLQTNLTGEFATGDVKHKLLVGTDYVRREGRLFSSIGDPTDLDLFNPVYGVVKPNKADIPGFGGTAIRGNSFGFFVQDQVEVVKNLKLLAGVRYDTLSQDNINIPGVGTDPGETSLTASAITPRLGLLYQFNNRLSAYGSYSQSFTPNSGTTVSGAALEPQRGKGYEIGVKSDLIDGKLFATLAYFDISKQNVPLTDPDNPLFSIASGEQRSRGIEFDIAGEPAPGLKLVASYAYTDAKVSADLDPTLVGKKLFGVPEHAASFWTTYELQQGQMKGLGFGAGLNFKGDRQGDLENTYLMGSYLTADAAIFYKKDDWRFGLNFKNISDAKYVESSLGSRGSGNNFGDPFTVIASVSVKF